MTLSRVHRIRHGARINLHFPKVSITPIDVAALQRRRVFYEWKLESHEWLQPRNMCESLDGFALPSLTRSPSQVP
jgi:hypothetical protein